MDLVLGFLVCLAALFVVFVGIIALLLTSRVVIGIILGLFVVWLWKFIKKHYDVL